MPGNTCRNCRTLCYCAQFQEGNKRWGRSEKGPWTLNRRKANQPKPLQQCNTLDGRNLVA